MPADAGIHDFYSAKLRGFRSTRKGVKNTYLVGVKGEQVPHVAVEYS
jgi:hypothetical protein